MLILINRSHIMGDRKNTLLQNIIAWSTAIVMIALTLAMIWTTVAGA
jgi:Mn2+/Fe2+ NRAMP family transporter